MISRIPKKRQSESGAVMFIVMLVLLMGTATAIFAMHTTSYEVRASGFNKRMLQTQNIGESGLTAMMAWTDTVTPQVMRDNWLVTCTAQSQSRDSTSLNLEPFEPEITDPTKHACRQYESNFNAAFPVPIIDSAASLGERQGGATGIWRALMMVDAYEDFDSGESVAGEDATGGGGFYYLDITFTARGRTRLTGDTPSGVAGDRDFHEGAADSRVFAITGPLMRPDGG